MIDERYYALSMVAQKGPRLWFGSVLHALSWFIQWGREVRGAVLVVVHCVGVALVVVSYVGVAVAIVVVCVIAHYTAVVWLVICYASVVSSSSFFSSFFAIPASFSPHCREPHCRHSAVVVIRHARHCLPCRCRPTCRDVASSSPLSSFVMPVLCSLRHRELFYAGVASVSHRMTCTAAVRHGMVIVVVADEVAGAA